MKIYDAIKINDHSYYINDEDQDSCYLIIGEQKALLIDLGLFKEPLLPTIKSLTDKEIIVVCSHGHIDHIGAINEFNDVYLSHLDRDVFFDNQKLAPEFILPDFKQVHDLHSHQKFDLGGIEIEAVLLAGHTPGSMIFLDADNKTIYTGDAIGSGCGVWMQLFHSLKLSEYRDNLKQVINYLTDCNVDQTWKFWGGHNQQESMSTVSTYNRLDFDLMKDMYQLTNKLINKEITGIKNNAPTFDDHQAYFASYQKAEMIYQENSLK